MKSLSDAQVVVLRVVAESGATLVPLTPDVFDAAGLTRPTLHRVVRTLVDEGLLHVRQETGEERGTVLGRPRLLLTLADAGRNALVAYRNNLESKLQGVNAALEHRRTASD